MSFPGGAGGLSLSLVPCPFRGDPKTGLGTPPSQVWGAPPARTGVPPPITRYAAGGTGQESMFVVIK